MRYLGVVLFAVDGANRQATRGLERGRRHGCGLVRRSSSAIAPDMGAVLYDNVMDDDLVDEFEVAVDARCSGIEDAWLVHGCKQLARGRTLGDYNVQEGSTVQQLLRLRGGGVRTLRRLNH